MLWEVNAQMALDRGHTLSLFCAGLCLSACVRVIFLGVRTALGGVGCLARRQRQCECTASVRRSVCPGCACAEARRLCRPETWKARWRICVRRSRICGRTASCAKTTRFAHPAAQCKRMHIGELMRISLSVCLHTQGGMGAWMHGCKQVNMHACRHAYFSFCLFCMDLFYMDALCMCIRGLNCTRMYTHV